MSRNLINIIAKIFDTLDNSAKEFDYYNSNYSHIIRKVEPPDDKESISFLKDSKTINYNKKSLYSKLMIEEFKSDIYVLITESNLSCLKEFEDFLTIDEKFENAMGLLAIESNYLKIRNGIEPSDIFNNIIGIEPIEGEDTINFEESKILDMFEEYYVCKIDISKFDITYFEDLYRLELLFDVQSREFEDINGLKKILIELLSLRSSNCILDTIKFITDGTIMEHIYLEIYHIIEYLFTLQHIIVATDKFKFDVKIFSEFYLESGLRVAERNDIEKVISNTPYPLILECLSIEEGCERYHNSVPNAEIIKKNTKKLAEKIYNVRCKIAHLKFGMPSDFEDEEIKEYIHIIIKVACSIYNKLDSQIMEVMIQGEYWSLR